MSVILECQPGEEIVCILDFHASPQGENFSWDTSRTFHVGERVRYAGAQQHAHYKDRANGLLCVFETPDGKRYAATQSYFVTDECWRGLEQYFCRTAMQA